MFCVKYLILFHPIHTPDFQGLAWKLSGLLRGLTGLVQNPGCVLNMFPFCLSSFNKQLETSFSRELGCLSDRLEQCQCQLMCHDYVTSMHLGGYACACVCLKVHGPTQGPSGWLCICVHLCSYM